MTDLQAAVRAAAVKAHKLGVCVLPAAEDGSKRPGDGGRWGVFKARRPTDAEMRGMFPKEGGPRGLGFVCGAVSGGLELFEFDSAEAEAEFRAMCAEVPDLAELIERLDRGYSERTPSGGLHWLYRCAEGALDSTKLARAPECKHCGALPDAHGALIDGKRLCPSGGTHYSLSVLIETKGEAGWVVVAPSGGPVHPTGKPYEMLRGGVVTIPTLTGAEREVLWGLARAMNRYRTEDTAPRSEPTSEPTGDRPGDVFNATATWAEILEPHGWKRLFTRGDETYWNRPGARDKRGIDATTGARGHDYFYVFSTSAEPFEAERGYDKLGVYALLNHGGDVAAAVKALSGERVDLEPIVLSKPQEAASQDEGTDTPAQPETASESPPEQPPRAVTFDHAFPEGHFVRRWVEWGLAQTDAAAEYHEACALVALACAMPDVRTRELPFWPRGLPANLYVMLIGPSSTSRKSTASGMAEAAVREVYDRNLLPDRMSPEGWIEQMAQRSDGAALWMLDELSKSFAEWGSRGKPQGQQMIGHLLSAWDAKPFTYARHSKRAKGAPEAEADNDTIKRSHLSIIGSATPSLYGVQGLVDLVEDGLLPRFAVVYGDTKPPRLPWGVTPPENEAERLALVGFLAAVDRWSRLRDERSDPVRVVSDPGVLNPLLDAYDAEMSDAAASQPVLGRIPAMALKVAMLSAVGAQMGELPTGNVLRITKDDARAAIKVTRRWARNAERFMFEVASGGHSASESKLTQIAAFVHSKEAVRRSAVMTRFRLGAFEADQVRDTLEQRGLIELRREAGKSPSRTSEVWAALKAA